MTIFLNLDNSSLITLALERKEASSINSGALVVTTGKWTGRCPSAKYFALEPISKRSIYWSDNQSISCKEFDEKLKFMLNYFDNLTHDYFQQNLIANHDNDYALNLLVKTTTAWQSLFARNMFIVPPVDSSTNFKHDWELFCAPELGDEPFVWISFEKQQILIGGTHYAGEIKKSVFTVLNFLLPEKGVLPMHCSVNVDKEGKNPAIFFGLSGTGKTTLSSDVNRLLVGDDEHCWTDNGLSNFEGGCYAKVINLSHEDEPQIWEACQKNGAILENVIIDDYNNPDFNDSKLTENTRSSYPLEFIPNVKSGGMCGHPKNVIMLTCDAFGVLPPVSKLDINSGDLFEHFILGYTAKVAGTETGISEPQATFSYCYGAPFMPRNPIEYANLLVTKAIQHNVDCWLVNTGWSGGPHGKGKRISISITRKIINAIQDGTLKSGNFNKHHYTGLEIPASIPGIDSKMLSPELTWDNIEAYKSQHHQLFKAFDNQKKKSFSLMQKHFQLKNEIY